MSARHAVLADQLVPVDLRVARIAGEPRLLGLPVARIAGQIPVIVGHRRAGVVPVEHAVLRDARLGGKRGGERGRSRQRHGIGGQGQRNRLAPHAGVAHPAVLPAPRRVVETVARERESLLRRGEARAPHRGRHDTQHGEFVPFAETPGKAQSGGHGIGEDPFDVHVAAGAGVESRRNAPAVARRRRDGGFRSHEVIAVGEADRSQKRLQRLPVRKPERPHAARRSRFPGRGGKPRIALFFGPEQAQRREVTVGNRNAHERRAFQGVIQSAAPERDLRQVETGAKAVEVRRGLHGAVEDRRIGREQFAPLLAFGIGIVFVAGVLGRRRTRKQEKQQGTTTFQHIFATLQNTKIAKSPTIQNWIACSAAKRSGKQKSRRDTAGAASDGDGA